jgi:uncharacterized protein YndB with AHSA1/START domain
MNTKNINHRVTLPAAPARVFAALINEDKHSQFTGEPAHIEARAGGAFTCYGNYISGVTLELKSGQRIVQVWRARDWPEGTYSIVTFALTAKPGGKTGLRFSQVGVPANDYASKNKGWRTHYWEPLKRFLQGAGRSGC